MDDYLIVDIAATLAASKRASYRDSVRAMYKTLVLFLDNNRLTTNCLINQDQQITDDLVIRRSDLTDMGFEVIKRKLDYWLDSVSSGKTKNDDTTILEAELQSVISNQKD